MTSSNNRLLPFLLIALIWMGHFIVDIMLGIWPVYKTIIHLDLAKAGLIVAIGAFIGEGSQLIFGSLSDRGYHKKIIMFGVLAASSATFLAYSTNYFVLFGLYLLTCIGSGAFHPAAAGLVSSIDPNRRSLLMAIFASGGSIGLAMSQIVFTNTYEFFNQQTFLLAIPTVVIICLLLAYQFPFFQVTPESTSHRLKDFIVFFKRSDLRHLYISQVANQAIFWGAIFILPDVLKTLGHYDWVCYGGGHMCLILGGAIMLIPSGYLADRYSARTILLYAGFIACATLYFILLSGGISMTLVLIALFVLGGSLAIANPLSVALGSRLVPNSPGTVSAFLMGLVWCVSEAIGPGGVGILSAWFEDYAPVKALALLGSLFIINIYGLLRLPKFVPETAYATSN